MAQRAGPDLLGPVLDRDPDDPFGEEDAGTDEHRAPLPAEQVRIIKEMIDEAEDMPILAGSTWYLVSSSWVNPWVRWCSQDGEGSFPPVNSSDLVDGENFHLTEDLVAIKEDLRERRDYVVMPENAWDLLQSWYGTEGPVLRRCAYEYARGETRIEIDLAKIAFTYVPASLEGQVQVSHGDHVVELKAAIRFLLSHTQADVPLPETLYFCFSLSDTAGSTKYALDDEEEWAGRTLEEAGLLAPDSHLWVDTAPCPEAKGMRSATAAFDQAALGPGSGLVGLRNLGNTCFMNSALQCLSNCVPLRQYFLSGAYAHEINRSNHLGTGGVLVEEFASLLRSIWGAAPFGVVDPLSFKYALARFEGRFMGYHQQDSQEFLSALLDRVHEDLNRIKQKPYVETPERAGRPDVAVAREAWDLHRSRNDSKLVDLFHGQLRSAVTCPTCSHVSVTFDPFMFLSLPMPERRARTLKVLIVADEVVDETDLEVPRGRRTVGALKEAVLRRVDAAPEKYGVELIEVFNGDIYRLFEDDDESLSNIRQPGDHIHAYVIRRDRAHVWMTFTLEGTARKLGYPILLPCAEDPMALEEDGARTALLHKSLVRFAQNPRLESDQLAIHHRQRERVHNFPSFHVAVAPAFLASFVTDCRMEEDDRPLLAFYHMFMAHHSRLAAGASRSAALRSEEVGLYECLDLFVQEEQLSPTESWYCPTCREHQEGAGKKLDLWALPDVLVVHLKRFSYQSDYGHKISTPVAFPVVDLSFEGRVLSDQPGLHYELFAVSEHFGGMGSGHYTALAKNSIDQHWYNFDDSQVSRVSEESLHRCRQSAYLLFYQRTHAAATAADDAEAGPRGR